MGLIKLTKSEESHIDELVAHFNSHIQLFETLRNQLLNAVLGSKALASSMHSVKSRIKDPEHLREKLRRKYLDTKGTKKPIVISKENLFAKINDLVGLRILHLHTQQIEQINLALNQLFDEFRYTLVEGPTAKTWDDENREYFKGLGIEPVKSPSLYTSVHYIIDSGNKSRCTCEIQVRTLAEELWGEVDHALNYPTASPSLACREQIKVLARATSSCSRLVDSIFRSSHDHREQRRKK
jgi:putative GTP pyrophosphokinase